MVDVNNQPLRLLMLWALNGLGLVALGLIVSGLVLLILSRPLVKLWYYLQEVEDETTNGKHD